MQCAAPPGARTARLDALIAEGAMAKVARVELVRGELVKDRQLGVFQVADLPGFRPEAQVQPQPIGLRTALRMVVRRFEHLR